MQTVREVALELGVSCEEVLARLRRMGAPVRGELSPVASPLADELRAQVRAPHGPHPIAAQAPPREPAGSPSTTMQQGRPPSPPPPEDREPRDERGRRRPSLLAQIAELPLLVLLAFVIAVVIKTFLVQAFFIPSTSMLPTLRRGDRVLVEKLSYRFRDPRPSDVVVFAESVFGRREPDLPWHQDARAFLRELLGLPTGLETDYIKRVVAVGGQTIRYEGSPRRLYVDGEVVSEPYVRGGRDTTSPTVTDENCVGMRPRGQGCLVPAGEVFVMGDNRASSEDSRVIGPVREDRIVGHAFVVIWPVGHASTL